MPAQSRARLSWLTDPRDRTLAIMLLAPLTALVLLIVVYPVLRLFQASLYEHSLTSGLPPQFVGIENFLLMLDDPVFWSTLGNTLLITVVTVPGALVVGLAGTVLVAMSIADPLRQLRWALGEVQRGNYNAHMHIYDAIELVLLQA